MSRHRHASRGRPQLRTLVCAFAHTVCRVRTRACDVQPCLVACETKNGTSADQGTPMDERHDPVEECPVRTS